MAPLLRTVTATKYLTPFREGGSLPGLVEADDDGLYVVKFYGAAQGPRALVAEVIAGELGRALGLPVPELVFVDVDPALAGVEPDPWVGELLQRSPGINLGLDYLPGSMTFDPRADGRPDADLAANIVWFDALVTNTDRSPRNPNLLSWHNRLWLIDHGASLFIHHTWREPEAHARRPLDTIAAHVLLPFASSIAGAHERLAALVTESALREIVELVPDAWLEPVTSIGGPPALREAYVRYLLTRVASRRPSSSRSRCSVMPREAFEYAILRVAPRVERGELVNVGVVLFCRTRRFLGVRVELGDRQLTALRAMAPDIDLDAVRAHLASIEAIVLGDSAAGPIAHLAAPERFRWVTSTSSTVIQPSDVHGGMTDDPAASLEELFEKLAR